MHIPTTSIFRCELSVSGRVPPWKLTWQWKNPPFEYESPIEHGGFSNVMSVFREGHLFGFSHQVSSEISHWTPWIAARVCNQVEASPAKGVSVEAGINSNIQKLVNAGDTFPSSSKILQSYRHTLWGSVWTDPRKRPSQEETRDPHQGICKTRVSN